MLQERIGMKCLWRATAQGFQNKRHRFEHLLTPGDPPLLTDPAASHAPVFFSQLFRAKGVGGARCVQGFENMQRAAH